ncbi:MAG TPA: AmmeMemoRadiSam system protein B, partial [Candidatus Moranbacteria bacterium]|nr:AmmeMemoRadiSam system protein B [Candidatus Moranbacteria bacterium]
MSVRFKLTAGAILIFGICFGYWSFGKIVFGNNQFGNQNIPETDRVAVNNSDKLIKQKTLPAVSFITPHHLVGKKLIAEIFSEVAKKDQKNKIDRIILVSPNHFNIGQGAVIVAGKDLSERGLTFKTDRLAIEKISQANFAQIDTDAFYKEHGIRNLLSFSRKYFPGVPVVNIMIKDGTPAKYMTELAKRVSNIPGNTLVILSSDFSHYLEKNISKQHDRKAVDVISRFDYPAIYNLDTDCVTGLYFLLKFSELKNKTDFVWVNNSSSSEIYGENFIGENTSYVTGYFTKQEKGTDNQNNRALSWLFFGDVMLDRQNRVLMDRKGVGFFTKKLERLFWGQDLNVVNLEGPITDKPSVSVGQPVNNPNHFRFTFSPKQSVNFLQANRINLVSIGNNHILNFRSNGLKQTEEILSKNNIDYFGDPLDLTKMSVVENIAGYKIAFVNYNRFNGFSPEQVVEIIKSLKAKSDFIVVYPHWGREYKLVNSERQQKLAHQFID